MKQESKIKRIFQAFTEESDLPQEVVEYRRSICETCPFNSKNTKDEDLSLLQRQRKTFSPDFCLKCGCIIEKKISRSSEACGMEEVGLKPLWNRITLKTVDKIDLDLKNHTPKVANLKLSDMKENYEIDFYSFKQEDLKPVVIEVLDDNVEEVKLNAYCECVKIEKLNEKSFSIFLDISKQSPNSNIIKTIEVSYTKEKKHYRSRILIKGKYEL